MTKRLLMSLIVAIIAFEPTGAQTPTEGDLAASSAARKAMRQGCYLRANELLQERAFDPAGEPRRGFVYDKWSEIQADFGGLPLPSVDRTSPPAVDANDADRLRNADRRDAIRTIVEGARRTRLVILNEDHAMPRDRAFALEVARALRPLGYDVLAIETLTNIASDSDAEIAMTKLSHEGYPHPTTGTYLTDPVFADFVRQSLKIGYKPIAYESTVNPTSPDPTVNMEQREANQTAYVLRRALLAHSKSKVLMYVGFDHVAEAPLEAQGVHFRWLANRLKEASGIDPLTIDQVLLNNPSEGDSVPNSGTSERSAVFYEHSMPIVIGKFRDHVDLQVVHPRTALLHGRPSWLVAMGRHEARIPEELLPSAGRRLVQAFVVGEEQSVPVDQVVVQAGKSPPYLMLPKGPIRYAYQDQSTPCPAPS